MIQKRYFNLHKLSAEKRNNSNANLHHHKSKRNNNSSELGHFKEENKYSNHQYAPEIIVGQR